MQCQIQAINNEWKFRILSHVLIREAYGLIMKVIYDLCNLVVLSFLHKHSVNSFHQQCIKTRDCVYLPSLWVTLIKSCGKDDWHVAGSWQVKMHFSGDKSNQQSLRL